MFDSKTIFKPENLEANFYDVEIIIRVSKNKIPVLKNPHNLNFGGGFGQAFKEFSQSDIALFGQRVVLDILILL
jgi:hypothetical protein